MKRINSQRCRAGRLYLRFLPILVWLAAVACVVGLFRRRAERFEVVGLAQSKVHQVAATNTGRLKGITVQLFDKVNRGQVLAVLDMVLDDERPRPLLQVQLDTIKAEIEHLVAESNATRKADLATIDNRVSGWVAQQRTFANDVVNARLRGAELTTQIETDKLTLEGLEMDIKSFLIQGRLDPNTLFELKRMRINRDTLAKQIEENQHMLDQSRLELQEALDRQDEFVKSNKPPAGASDDEAQDVVLKATKVLDQRVKELNEQLKALDLRESLELRSSFDGVVSQINHQPGEAVLAGEPILTIAETEPSEIVAYAREDQLGLVRESRQVEIIKDSEPPQIAWSEVSYIGPAFEQMPARLWRNPNIPQWGRPILIKIPPGLKLIPGELVGIRGI